MAENIKVSVIVPVYNVEKYLERCLESLVQQTLAEIQIIVVNDGSPDHSQEIIDRYVKAYPDKVMGLLKENGGLSDARNYGIPYAKGEYLAFVDSDDYLDVHMYEKMYRKAVETDSDIVTCGYFGINEVDHSTTFFQKGNTEQFGMSIHDNPKLLYTNAPYAWNKIYRRSFWEKTGIRYPKGKIYEDIATTYPLMLHANRVSKVDECLYYYILKREGAITATFSDKILQMFDSLAILNDYYISQNAFDEFEEVLGFINLKHTILRFRDFSLYNNRKLQFKVVKRGFDQLNKYFKNWKHNHAFIDFYYSKHRFVKLVWPYRITWYAYSLMPNGLIHLAKKTKKFAGKVARAMTSKNYLMRYHYAKKSKKAPIIKNQVLFESFHGSTVNDSPFAMARELAKDPQFTIYYTTTKELKKQHQQVLDTFGLKNVRLVPLGTLKYQDVLATSQYLVNNVSFPPYYMKREGQICINTWHGTPLKTLGKKMAGGIQDMSNMQRNFLHSTYLLHPNEFTMDHMMEDYNLSNLYTGKVLVSGYPRNTVFSDKEAAAKVRSRYQMDGKEVFAYMPTWRGATSEIAGQTTGYAGEVRGILKSFDESLSDNQILYVNLHSLVQAQVPIEGYRHIRRFPSDIDNYSFLNAVDVLITDYSSVFFDFSITGKPIVMFMYDYDTYMAERGTYFSVKELPFEKIYSLDDMKSYFARSDKSQDKLTPEYQAYIEKFIRYDDDRNTKRLNDYIFYGKEPEFDVYDYAKNREIPHAVYLAGTVRGNADDKKLEVVNTMENPVTVFLRKDFTANTQRMLMDTYNDSLDYMVCDVQMSVTLYEYVKTVLESKLNRPFRSDAVYRRELERILPDLKISGITSGDHTYRDKALIHAFENCN